MATTKTKAKTKPAEPEEIGWTIRMPKALAERVKARAVALTAEGRGKWTGNMVVVEAIRSAAESWPAAEGDDE